MNATSTEFTQVIEVDNGTYRWYNNKWQEVNDVLQQKGYLYRIYPTKQQQQLINQTLGCVRFVYNRFLNIRK
ncbi:MAG: helix-turn-helix domain-containing protein, partial [Selenomonadaceae bacterium]|nr:helix-turn-helix domain-containing protein [Selenomonadaceae bacterium]